MKKRVKIPLHNPAALLDLAKKVESKHLADGDASVLKSLNWSEISATLQAAVTEHEKATRRKREMAQAYQQRNLNMDSITDTLRDCRDVLSGLYKKEMKVLGEWGYEVLDVRTKGIQSKPIEASPKV